MKNGTHLRLRSLQSRRVSSSCPPYPAGRNHCRPSRPNCRSAAWRTCACSRLRGPPSLCLREPARESQRSGHERGSEPRPLLVEGRRGQAHFKSLRRRGTAHPPRLAALAKPGCGRISPWPLCVKTAIGIGSATKTSGAVCKKGLGIVIPAPPLIRKGLPGPTRPSLHLKCSS